MAIVRVQFKHWSAFLWEAIAKLLQPARNIPAGKMVVKAFSGISCAALQQQLKTDSKFLFL